MKSPRIPITLQQAVMDTLREKLCLANQRLARAWPLPELTYQQRGTSAGTAWLEKWQIRLNPTLLLENQRAFIEQVVPHELAHLLTWKYFGRVAPHGKEWRWVMENILEVPAQRTHCFAVTSVQSQSFAYRCRCQQHQLTLRRHNRILRGKSEYRCLRCGEKLTPANALS